MFNTLRVSRKVEFGFYLDDGNDGILLPKRFAPKGLRIGDAGRLRLLDGDRRTEGSLGSNPRQGG